MFVKKKKMALNVDRFKEKQAVLGSEAPDKYFGLNITSSPKTARRLIITEGIFKVYEKQKNSWDCLGMEPLMWQWVTHLGAEMKTAAFIVGAAEPTF